LHDCARHRPLSFTGQEFVWRALFTSIGLTEAEIDEYFSGPAFFAWQRMVRDCGECVRACVRACVRVVRTNGGGYRHHTMQ
jgi:hypothetical protein